MVGQAGGAKTDNKVEGGEMEEMRQGIAMEKMEKMVHPGASK